MADGPTASATVTVKVCEDPDPEAGRAETTVGGPPSTVHEPVVTHRLHWLALFWTMAKVLLAPANATAKLRGKLRMRLLPLGETEAPVALSVHWPLESEPDVPGVMGPWKMVPASFSRYKPLAALL